MKEYQLKAKEFIDQQRPFRLRVSHVGKNASKLIQFIISELAAKYDLKELKSFIFTSVRESIENGIKANMKRAIFHKHGVNIHDESEYLQGMEILRDQLRAENLLQIIPMAKAMGFYAELVIHHNNEVLQIYIKNNAPMTTFEERRVREKFKSAMSIPDFSNFLEHGIDFTEGAGLGIALTIAILRNLGLDPNTYRIYRNDQYTVVRLIFPLQPDYIDERESYSQKHRLTSLFE